MQPMNRLRKITRAAVLLTLVTAGAANANLISNGSFESAAAGFSGGPGRQYYVAGINGTSISDWTLEGTGDVYLHLTPDIGNVLGQQFNFSQLGNQYLDLSGGSGGGTSGNHATIFQDFITTPSDNYELSFFVGAAYSPLPSINVQLAGASSILDQTVSATAPATNIVWTRMSFQFVADSATTRLSFRDISGVDDNYSFVDNVSVSAIPEPATALLVGLGLVGMAAGRRV